MPRGPRLDAPGELHHVIARGIERGRVFPTDFDRLDFLTRLGDLVTAMPTAIYASCLIPNISTCSIGAGKRGPSMSGFSAPARS